jgi:hypothetical protein
MMCGGKVIPSDHRKRRHPSQVLSAGKREMRRSRLADEHTETWEAEFQESMAADDEEGIEPFLIGFLAHHYPVRAREVSVK